MLRYMLLAGAAALALPCTSLAQVQWSQPLPGENNASSVMDNPGVLNSPMDYDIPFNQAPTGYNAGVGGYATAQAEDQTRSGEAYVPDASEDTVSAQGPQAGGVYGGQPSGGYYFGSQGDQPLASADQSAAGPQGAYGGPPEGAYGGQPYQGYTGGGAPNQPYAGPPQGAYSAPPPSQGYTGGGYYTGQQGAVPSQPYAGQPQGAYSAPPPSQGYTGGGYYTGQQGASGGQAYDAQSDIASGQALVIVPASGLSTRKYVRETTASNLYQIQAAKIALRRSKSPQVRDYANQMIQQNGQGLAVITQASVQAGVPQRPRLDQAHRRMLAQLRRVAAGNFDAVYMNQQVVTHMNQVAVQRGYALNGDNSALQQVASQSDPAVRQNLDVAWNLSGQPDRLAAQRTSEYAMLDQNIGRGQTYRGYTVIGPTSKSELASRSARTYRGYTYRGYTSGGVGYTGRRRRKSGYWDEFNYNSLKGGAPTGASYQQGQAGGGTGGAYQGYTSGAGAQPGTSGTTGYGPPPGAGATPGAPGYGGPAYQGYTSPSTPGFTAPQYTSPSGPGPTSAPPYQGAPGSPGYSPGPAYTSPSTPGYQGYTSPNAPGYQGYTSPNAPSPNPSAPSSSPPSYTGPGSPGYTGPGSGYTGPGSGLIKPSPGG